MIAMDNQERDERECVSGRWKKGRRHERRKEGDTYTHTKRGTAGGKEGERKRQSPRDALADRRRIARRMEILRHERWRQKTLLTSEEKKGTPDWKTKDIHSESTPTPRTSSIPFRITDSSLSDFEAILLTRIPRRENEGSSWGRIFSFFIQGENTSMRIYSV